MILELIKSIFKTQKQTCMDLYIEAKKKRPEKEEIEYLKLILLTKPPFDYQLDVIIDEILKTNNSIDKLSDFITDIKTDNFLWETRKKNLKMYKEKLKLRNQSFFQHFWS
jgi:hypothetical protein